jgi:preprotein translocase subunit YajC
MFINEAIAQTATQASTIQSSGGISSLLSSGGLMQLLPFIIIFGFMYLLVMRPQMKKQKEQRQMISNITKGDEVITISGILGRISKVNDSYIILEIANNTEIKLQKSAIANVLPKGTIKDIE